MTLRCPRCGGMISTNSMHLQHMSEKEKIWCICKFCKNKWLNFKAFFSIMFGEREVVKGIKARAEKTFNLYKKLPEGAIKNLNTIIKWCGWRLRK